MITREDLALINNLSSRAYTGLTLSSNTTEEERNRFSAVKLKMKRIAEYFAAKYGNFGTFITNVSPDANPITRGNTLNYVWSTFFKGATNKQYAAQISFVINKQIECLNVGFYFGSASAHSLNEAQRNLLENNLSNLGSNLSNVLANNNEILGKYNSLFDLGFTAYIGEVPVLPNDWINRIISETPNARIYARIFPNDFGIIESSTIDFYVSQIIFLMASINDANSNLVVTPLTPQQWAKKAERNAQIGLEGELFVLRNEEKRLINLGINRIGYPKHVALESNHYGFDILSLDSTGNEIFIEVKTTTRKSNDPNSNCFFMSNNEYNVYCQNKERYKLHRVFDVENTPGFEELNLEELTLESDGYKFTY